jgi:gamma-glutamyl hercynylcysteine S-oxide synthase
MQPTVAESLPPSRAVTAERFETVRARTLALVESLSEDALNRVHDPLMSPIVWDLGHIATFEDLWLAQTAFGVPPLREGLERVYDPFSAPRSERGELPYLRSEDALSYMQAVRERVLELLASADLSLDAGPLLAGGLVYEMVLRHEQQHSETILQTLQTISAEAYTPGRVYATPAVPGRPSQMLLVPEGRFEMGARAALDGGRFSYDNERPRHEAELPAFFIDPAPVTNGDFIAFIEDGGYEREELWSEEGRRWLQKGRRLPRYWERDADGFTVRSFSEVAPVDPALPLCHVSWYEADAFARYAGKRLPSEAEWEKAASSDSQGPKRAYPWGDTPPTRELANLDQLAFGPAPAGAYAEGASPCGARQMTGDVWEWTASPFDGYPGFEAFPYREYSEEFFGGPYRVLRGGSWATQPEAVTNTFRNWDYPERRQIFAGLRCARDA